jgi:hypothetical protein
MSAHQQDLFSAQPSHSGPVYVPFVRSSETSRAAAEKIRPKLQVRERQVLGCYVQAFPRDLTDNEVIALNVIHHNGVRARRGTLVTKGFLKANGERNGSTTHIWTGKKEEEL